jgi:hypothetical protein
MSVFQVTLQNTKQGRLDIDPTTGVPFVTSKQRQIWIAGPHGTYRLRKDGDVFTDSNYFKQYCYPQMSLESAFLTCTTDDGSIYSAVPEENTFAVGGTFTLATAYNGTNKIDFVTTYGSPAKFLQVTNNDAAIAITGELNGDTNVTFTLAAGETQVFNSGDLAITMIRLKSASGTPTASVIASVRSVSKS